MKKHRFKITVLFLLSLIFFSNFTEIKSIAAEENGGQAGAEGEIGFYEEKTTTTSSSTTASTTASWESTSVTTSTSRMPGGKTLPSTGEKIAMGSIGIGVILLGIFIVVLFMRRQKGKHKKKTDGGERDE